MIAEYLTECGVEQMDGAVIARGCGAALRVYFESHFVSCGEGAAFNMADVQIYAVRLFVSVTVALPFSLSITPVSPT